MLYLVVEIIRLIQQRINYLEGKGRKKRDDGELKLMKKIVKILKTEDWFEGIDLSEEEIMIGKKYYYEATDWKKATLDTISDSEKAKIYDTEENDDEEDNDAEGNDAEGNDAEEDARNKISAEERRVGAARKQIVRKLEAKSVDQKKIEITVKRIMLIFKDKV